MYKFGLKLWSNNRNYIEEAMKLYEERRYDYIELYTVPGTYDSCIDIWRKLRVPFVIHGPHGRNGVNLAEKSKKESNIELILEAQKYADTLGSGKIILHSGVSGDIRETAEQLKIIKDARVLIENKPYYALSEGLICNGNTPQEIEYVMTEAKVGFCLDIGHAVFSARAHHLDAINFLKDFLLLKPAIYHISDGDSESVLDQHEHIGKGDFKIQKILSLLPGEAMLTVETKKDLEESLNDFRIDVELLRSYCE